jgi:hypothetical protein
MTTLTAVKHLNVIEDDSPSLLTSLEGLKINTFGFAGVEKAFRHRIVPTIPFAAHAGLDAMMTEKP